MNKVSFVPFTQVDLENGFWAERYALNKRVSVENVKLRFEETGRFDALRFNFLKTGRRPHIFYDSDVAKWMEAVAYLAAKDPDSQKDNLALCEELIDCMEKAQREDGYLNSAHQQLTPETIFRNRGDHELYCAGHLAEAAVAYHIATGKDRFLKITEKVMALVRRVFMEEDSAAFATPGHEEIELALMTLYRHTGKKEYFELAKFFLEKRGNNPKDTLIPHTNAYSLQDDTDIYHLKDANGHCVRALYFYLGIADLVKETGDETLLQNLRSVFEDIAERKMYITGGVGAT
ncbi:MAG: glycoside hydrolase family 127 protein, partial [Clostridia bacterium]|nr:glycoside hydrolase family 127 protein [Clostridia bacterium]